MESSLMTILLIVLGAAVAVWLINLIPARLGLEMIKMILIVAVVVIALSKLLGVF